MHRQRSQTHVQHLLPVENKKLVAESNGIGRQQLHIIKRSQQKSVSPMGQKSTTSNDVTTKIDFCKFVSNLLCQNGLSRSQADYISQNAWRSSTLQQKKGMFKYWEGFSKETHKDLYHVMGFLEFLCNHSEKYSVVHWGRDFILTLLKLIGKPLSQTQRFLADKFLVASLNVNPPSVQCQPSTWDVNILLEYFVKLGPNHKISKVNSLARKLILQILLTQICQSGGSGSVKVDLYEIAPRGSAVSLTETNQESNSQKHYCREEVTNDDN